MLTCSIPVDYTGNKKSIQISYNNTAMTSIVREHNSKMSIIPVILFHSSDTN